MKNKETMYLKALELSTEGNVSGAKKLIKQVLKEDPYFAKAHYLLGWIVFEYTNDLEKAKDHARKAIKCDPDNPLGYYLYCDVLIADQDLEEIKSITEGISNLKFTDKAFIYHKLANAYEARRQYVNAIFTLRKSKDYGTSRDWSAFVDNEILRVRRKLQVA